MDRTYSVVLTGQLVAGRDRADVQNALAGLFKTSVQGIEQLLAKAPVKIKANVDRDTALQYKIAVEKAGALCEIDTLEDSASHVAAGEATAAELAVAEAQTAPELVDDAGGGVGPTEPHDVYAPPMASLEDDLVVEAELTEPQKVSAGRAWAWMVSGFRSFRQDPLAWVLLTLLSIVIMFGLAVIPFLGFIGVYVLMPLLTGGIMKGCAAQQGGQSLEVKHLFAGFEEHGAKLAMLGGLILGSVLLLSVAFFIIAILVALALGVGLEMLSATFDGDVSGLGAAGAVPIIILVLLLFGLMFVVMTGMMMAFWFAPALIVMHDLEVMESVRLSFKGCLRNWVPVLLVEPLLWMLATVPILLTFGLAYFVFVPVVMASVYYGYREIFTA